ncbi:RNA 2',3'-cyclic phosphodiesterase [Desemzia sp. RIT804]|uniref:RNA 2',3'-cyclic phosphodiesterase n=1 Tax=Desemzia sp. RIT 804 TaxID=2810209 RepID=UPI00194FAB0D|nr:RNA 2',3'-cyclic phosphodiesterase [Desemzia sp. RIT 804]MBM6613789.1 RNA 2',3'-cyclic phosphodiesterase [Desemzia sp. RIT 804]
MRLFIGIELSQSVKESLFVVQQQLKPYSIKGKFTSPKNFHLTLEFIGEATEKEIEVYKTIISSVAEVSSSFVVSLDHIGKFIQKNKSILWAGPSTAYSLNKLYDRLHVEFSSRYLEMDKKQYTPHITLGRNIVLNDSFEQVKKELHWNAIPLTIDNITLFESTHINGHLVYRAIEKQQMAF